MNEWVGGGSIKYYQGELMVGEGNIYDKELFTTKVIPLVVVVAIVVVVVVVVPATAATPVLL